MGSAALRRYAHCGAAAHALAALLLCACSSAETPSRGRVGSVAGTGGMTGGAASVDGGGFGNVGGGGAGGAAGTANGGGLAPDAGCARVSVNATVDVKPGNLLVIFDRSLTMNDPFDTPSGPQPKYAAAGAALLSSLSNLACPATSDPAQSCTDPLTVGAVIFPSAPICTVDPIETATTQIDFRPARQFIDAWNAYWSMQGLVFTTPFNGAFLQGDAALHRADLVGNKAVVFFTDGESFCDDGLQAPALAAKWASEGIKTYVVGLPGATGVTILRDTAAAGGTTDYITPADSAVLEDELRAIAVATTGFESCTFTIEGRITDAELACSAGEVTLDGTAVPCDPQDGFSVDDAMHLTFHGAACAALEASSGRLDARFPCDVIAPPD